MKIKIIILTIFCMSCNKSRIIETNFFDNPAWIENLITKYNCKEEYDYAKLLVNLSSYNETCFAVFCPPYNYNQKVRTEKMNFYRIELHNNEHSGISISGDTITFYFVLVNRDSCYCTDGLVHYPGHITMLRGSKEIIWINHGSIDIRPDKENIEKRFKEKKMLDYLIQNKDSVDPWFYNQLVKRGYLK